VGQDFMLANQTQAPCPVLVVEDDRLTAEVMRLFLSAAGYDTRIARTGWEAVKTARRIHPKVLICDLELPGMTGWDVARALRNLAFAENTYMIALSGLCQEKDQLRSFEAGFDRHLAKPVDPEVLCRILADQLKPNYEVGRALS
jgi:CheY-like chemotaxis protein